MEAFSGIGVSTLNSGTSIFFFSCVLALVTIVATHLYFYRPIRGWIAENGFFDSRVRDELAWAVLPILALIILFKMLP